MMKIRDVLCLLKMLLKLAPGGDDCDTQTVTIENVTNATVCNLKRQAYYGNPYIRYKSLPL